MSPPPDSPKHEALIGTRIGHYTLTRVLGHGAMGVVYLAVHDRLDRAKAVKVLDPGWADDSELVRRFFSEALAASACRHPHIVEVDDCGTQPHRTTGVFHYIMMEHLEGVSLADELEGGAPLPVERAVKLTVYAADALAAAHERGIVHRDIKPANLFLVRRGGRSDYVKVLDFGIAQLTGTLAPGVKTRTGNIFGTPEYMSPEQARGVRVDLRSDIYSLGVVLYEMLTTQLPLVADTFTLLAAKLANEMPPPIAQLRPQLPPGVCRAVERAMAKRPEERFATMRELARALVATDAAPQAMIAELSLDTPLDEREPDPAAIARAEAPTLPGTMPDPAPPAAASPELSDTVVRRGHRNTMLWVGAAAVVVGAILYGLLSVLR